MAYKYIAILAVKVMAAGLLFASQLLPAKYMDLSSYGTYAYLVSILTVSSAIVIWGGDKFVIKLMSLRKKAVDPRETDKKMFGVYSVVIINTAIIGLFLFIYFSYFIVVEPGLEFEIVLLTLLVISLSRISASSTKGLDRVVLSEMIFNIVRPTVFIMGILVCFYYLQVTMEIALLILLVSYLISFILTGYINYTIVGSTISKSVSAIPRIYVMSFSFFLIGVGGPLLANIDLIQLGAMTTVEDVALYSVPSKIVNLVLLGLVSVNLLIAPKLSPLFSDGKVGEIRNIIRDNNKFVAALTFIPVLVIIFYSESILVLFGEDYIMSVGILHVLLIGQVVNVFCGPVLLTCVMVGKQKMAAVIVLSMCLIEWGLCAMLIPLYGGVGAAYANVITCIVLNILLAYVVYRHMGVNVTMVNLFDRLRGI